MIKLPDGYVGTVMKNQKIDGSAMDKLLRQAVIDGTPLPKGHGDLKDANKLKHTFISWSMAVQGHFTDADIASIVCNSPTIIEADSEKE